MAKMPKVLILAGGLGTRLRSVVHDRPKALAEIGGVPFLNLQLKWLANQGVKNVFLLAGYMSDQIVSFVGDGSKWKMKIDIIQEPKPFGTGGAVANATRQFQISDDFILLNGDSLTEIYLPDFYKKVKNSTKAYIIAVHQKDVSRFGRIEFNNKYQLIGFQEKISKTCEGWINSGIYYFPSSWFDGTDISKRPISLEQDLIPEWLINKRTICVFTVNGEFVDIGSPESYLLLQEQGKPWHTRLLL